MRVDPLPGEALESWLAALATRMNATWGEVLDAVLPTGSNGTASSHRGAVLTTGVSDAERDSISAATGVSGADIDTMTLAGHYGSPLITIDPRTGRARTPWGLLYRQRFCPFCMRTFPGRRKLEWFLPWISTCTEHRCLLADTCPRCAQTQMVSDWFNRWMSTHPDRCRRTVKTDPRSARCLARLSTSRCDRLRPGHPVLTMQDELTELLTEDIVDVGVYRSAPVSAAQLLIDVQVLGNRMMRAPSIAGLVTILGDRASEREVTRWLNTAPIPDQTRSKNQSAPGATRLGLTQPGAWVGAGVAAALTVLMQPSLQEAGTTLRTATSTALTRELRFRTNISRPTHSAAVRAVEIQARATASTVLNELRYRTITGLPRLPDTPRFASKHAMLDAVPTLFWAEWAFRLDTEDLPWGTARQVLSRLLLTIGCVMATGELERRLHSTVRSQRFGEAANSLRAHPNWEGSITALLRLHEYLQAKPPPIDYQRRRDLSYTYLLPEAHWVDLVAEQGAGTTATTATAARLWLIEQLSGAPVRTTEQSSPTPGACTDRMRKTLTPQLVAILNTVAVDFLRAHGVGDEPPTWEPPLTLLEGLTLPGSPPEAVSPKAIHELLVSGLTIPAIARHLDTSVWKVRHQLERHPLPGHLARTRSTTPVRGPTPVVAAP
jgi:hypothetical protein